VPALGLEAAGFCALRLEPTRLLLGDLWTQSTGGSQRCSLGGLHVVVVAQWLLWRKRFLE